jgi:hypothetical protein
MTIAKIERIKKELNCVRKYSILMEQAVTTRDELGGLETTVKIYIHL